MTLCLVVDDDRMACKIASDVAGSVGLEVAVEYNGLAALTFCEKRMPEIIILDIVMPKLDGIGFLNELHKMMGGRNVHVIACTAKSDPVTINSLKEAGIQAFILKPFKPEALKEKLTTSGRL